ncbi:MAG: ROK family protein [Terracidiphilus sp.]|nr:ROK family protein [Terracidiphilus sp.]MDR3799486.1 ROK family protein [Terracidiphilus sp.]
MTTAIGVVITDHIAAARLKELRLAGKVLRYPGERDAVGALEAIPDSTLVDLLAGQIASLAGGEAGPGEEDAIDAIGVAVPGFVRSGVVEESPNLPQMKGTRLADQLTAALKERGITAPVHIANDADAIAAGVAATRGRLDKLTRVWSIGNGIGYGRWPHAEGVWEGGHITVTLDPKERYCGCGGIGHLEGIMGYRAMRMRFLDLEPEEVFANAKNGDVRCRQFVDLWHRALAAATASFIHLAGPGRFYFTGKNVGFLELPLLRTHLETMVRMSPLQSFSLEILPPDDETALIGAGVSALRAMAKPN